MHSRYDLVVCQTHYLSGNYVYIYFKLYYITVQEIITFVELLRVFKIVNNLRSKQIDVMGLYMTENLHMQFQNTHHTNLPQLGLSCLVISSLTRNVTRQLSDLISRRIEVISER